MKTDDLIALLATRAGAERRPATGAALVRAVCVGLLGSLAAMLVNMGTGILAGALVLVAVELAKKLKSKA